MADFEIPEKIQNFIDRYVHSVAHLEVILFLHRHSDRKWSAQEVSRELRSNISYAEYQLRELCNGGLVTRVRLGDKTFAYYSPDGQWKKIIEELGQLYEERRVTVINAIYAQRVNAIRNFAAAFKLKGSDKCPL